MKDAVLRDNVKRVKVLNARANKGTIKSLYLQIEIGKLCSEAYAYWKANKKLLGMKRDDLTALYGYGNTYFGRLRKVSDGKIYRIARK